MASIKFNKPREDLLISSENLIPEAYLEKLNKYSNEKYNKDFENLSKGLQDFICRRVKL